MKRLGILCGIALAMSATAAHAVTFNLFGAPGSSLYLPSDHDGSVIIDPFLTVNKNSGLSFFNQTAAGFGLAISGPGKISFSFEGKEAAYNNWFQMGSTTLTNASPLHASGSILAGPGLLAFKFLSNGGPAVHNGGGAVGAASIVFRILNSTTALILFNDSAPVDADYDDMKILMKVSPVPVPAALPLFATGLGILGWLGWRRLNRTAAAV